MTKPSSSQSVTSRRRNANPPIVDPHARDEAHCLAKMPAPTYIISRVADPIFAVVIGMSAAVTRINREEKRKGRTTDQTIEAGLR